MRKSPANQHGFGLLVMVVAMAAASLLVAGSAWHLVNQSADIQLKIDETKAHYIAQAGVMRSLRDWYNNSINAEVARRYDKSATGGVVVGGASQLYNVGTDGNDGAPVINQSSFAHIVPGMTLVKWVTSSANNSSVGLSGTEITITIPAPGVAAGNFLVILMSMDANGTNPVVNTGGVANQDSKANVYTRHINLSSVNTNAVPRLAVFSAPITTALVGATDTVRVQWTTATVAKAVTILEFSGVDTYNIASTTGTGTSTTPLSGNAVTTQAPSVLVAGIAVEGSLADAFTAGTNYIKDTTWEAGAGTTTAGAVINPEFRLVSATGTYTATGTITSRDWAAGVASFYAANRWFPSGANRRLRQWQIYNVHSSSSITLDQVKISWSPAGAELMNDFVLNGVSKWPGGTFASGSTIDITDTTLNSGEAWGGSNTYIQWNGDVNGGGDVTVTCQFIFSDDSATLDSKTHPVTLWNGAQAGAGMPMDRSMTITSTGQVNQTQGTNNFKVMKTIKATVSGRPATAAAPAVPQMEITAWEEGEKNIP